MGSSRSKRQGGTAADARQGPSTKRSRSAQPNGIVPLQEPPSVAAARRREQQGGTDMPPLRHQQLLNSDGGAGTSPAPMRAINGGAVSPSSSVSLSGRSATTTQTMGAMMDMLGSANKETEDDLLDSCATRTKKKLWKIDKFPSFNTCGSTSETQFVAYMKDAVFRNYSNAFFESLLRKIKKKCTEALRFKRSASTLEIKENVFGGFFRVSECSGDLSCSKPPLQPF